MPEAQTARPRGVPAPERPAVETPGRTAFTWRQSFDQAETLDLLTIDMRRALGGGRVDKADLLWALVRACNDDPYVRGLVVARLKEARQP